MCNVLSQQNVWKRPGTSTAKVQLCKMLQNCFMCEQTGIHKAFGVQKAEGFSPTWMVVDRHLAMAFIRVRLMCNVGLGKVRLLFEVDFYMQLYGNFSTFFLKFLSDWLFGLFEGFCMVWTKYKKIWHLNSLKNTARPCQHTWIPKLTLKFAGEGTLGTTPYVHNLFLNIIGGREGLRPIFFGNGQNNNNIFFTSQSRPRWQSDSVNKQYRLETDLLFFFFVVDVIVLAFTLVIVTEFQAQNCTSHIPVCSDRGRGGWLVCIEDQ